MGEKKLRKFGVCMPRPIVFQIDKVRGDIPRSRFILRILERALAATSEQEKGKQWYDSDKEEVAG
jgi:hypothetical protein